MSAVAIATVPKLWESTVGDDLITEKDGQFLNVYANWNDDRPGDVPMTYSRLSSGPFHMGLYLLPGEARKYAKALLKAADLADATQVALNAGN